MPNVSRTPPGLSDVLEARRALRPHLVETPLYRYPALDELLGCKLWVKHENHQPVGAFKVRGGIHLVSSLGASERAGGVITASTGNHGQSIAYAARLFGVAATVAIPRGSNPSKVESMRALGAGILVHGDAFDDAREEVERRAAVGGPRYVHSANEPLLIAGVATCALEILERVPDLDVLVVPVGGGSGAAGAGLVVKTLRPRTRLIAVQAEAAPAASLSWRRGRLVDAPQSTIAEGLATRTAFDLTQRMLRDTLDDFVLVSDDAMLDAVRLYLEKARTLAEPSGAASLAAVCQLSEELRGLEVAVVLSGGNISPEQLRSVLDR